MLRLHVQTSLKAQQAITLVVVLAKGVDRRVEGEVEGFVEDEKEEEQKKQYNPGGSTHEVWTGLADTWRTLWSKLDQLLPESTFNYSWKKMLGRATTWQLEVLESVWADTEETDEEQKASRNTNNDQPYLASFECYAASPVIKH